MCGQKSKCDYILLCNLNSVQEYTYGPLTPNLVEVCHDFHKICDENCSFQVTEL